MKKNHLLILFLLSLLVAILASVWIEVPGYMDAEYYFSDGLSLSTGKGFREEFIWNFLNDPIGLPTPSHQYWMPATSILSAISMAILGDDFRIAQVPFVLLASFIPPITALLAYKIHMDQRLAWLSGLLALFSGFYLPFLVTTDTFAIYTLVGTGTFWSIYTGIKRQSANMWIVVGLLAGVAHLSRADGLLVLGVAILACWLWMKNRIRPTVFLLLGYVLVMLPWGLHNLNTTGAIMSASSTRVLWALSYDELFSFPAEKLNFNHWWDAGIGQLVGARILSCLTNLQSLFVVNGLVYLGPFMILGAYRFRHLSIVRVSVIFITILFIVMSFVFPFAGARGGFFHSSSAVMSVLWVLAPVGLLEAIKYGVKKRGWVLESSLKVFSAAFVALAILTTLGIFYIRVIGSGPSRSIWSSSQDVYQEVAQWFNENVPGNTLIAINNPPGFYVASGRQSVVIPDGGAEQLLQVVDRFDIDWVVLDSNNPGLADVYEAPTSISWLKLEDTLEPLPGTKIRIFRVALD